MRTLRRWFVTAAACVLAGFGAALHAADDPAKELAALEDSFETSPLAWTEAYPLFRPKYQALVEKYPGTPEALTARLRLLEFTSRLHDDKAAQFAESGKLLAETLLAYPRSEQYENLPEKWYLFSEADYAKLRKALSDPAQPDCVKAACLLFDARNLAARGKPDEARPKLEELVEKYKDVPCRTSTYGELADAILHPHPAAALAVGRAAPDIVGKSVDGKTIKLSSFKGRVVVIDFFGDW